MTRKEEDLRITAFGAVTAIGLSAPAVAAAARSGIAGFGNHRYMVDSAGDPMVVAEVPGVARDASTEDRILHLTERALAPVLGAIGQEPRAADVFVGVPLGRAGVTRGLARRLQDLVAAHPTGRSVQLSIIEGGHSAGLTAMIRSAQRVASGAASVAIGGGVDSLLDPDGLECFEADERLHTGRNPWGFIPGEAACFCAVMNGDEARRRQLHGVQIVGFGEAIERHNIFADTVCTGEGLVCAIEQALAAGDKPIDHTICDLNGEPYRADEYSFALIRLRPRFSAAHTFATPADCWGDAGAASGPLFALLATAQHAGQYAAGPRTLIWTSSDSGERAAMVLANSER